MKETMSLIKAVINDDESMVCALIKAGANVNATDDDKQTPLFYAAKKNNDAGADVNATEQDKQTSLSHAASQKHYGESMVRALIDAGADVNVTDLYGKTPLFCAAQNNKGESMVRALIDAGADVNATDQDKQTPLFNAAQNYNGEGMVCALIDAGADVNVTDQYGKTPLLYVAQNYNGENMVRALIDAGADVNVADQDGKTPLFYATSNKAAYETLVKDGNSDLHKRDRYGRTPLFYALLSSSECARYFLDNGAKLDIEDNCNPNMLSFFIEKCGPHKLISEWHADINIFYDRGVTKETVFQAIVNVMFCKAVRTSIESIDSDLLNTAYRFVDEKIAVNQSIIENMVEIVKQKDTPYMNKLSKMLQLLNKLGANPNYADEDGNTALHYATRLAFQNVEHGKVIDICNQLKAYGANFHARNHEKETPLLFCLSEDAWKTANSNNICSGAKTQVEVCRFLLKHGSSVDDTTRNSESVFHLTMKLIGRYIKLDDRERPPQVQEAIHLLHLFSSSNVEKKHVSNNQCDVHLNSPLHIWASLRLEYTRQMTEDFTFKRLLSTTLKFLLECGVKVNDRNADGRTPLHLCQTWTAAKLLLKNGANPNDVDSSQCPPLLVAAKKKTFLKKMNCFYPDVTEDPTTFWKTALDKKLDPWAVDKNGQSVLGILLESEGFILAKALLKVICKEKYIVSDAITVSLLNAICKDKSPRTHWKNNLVEILIKSKKSGLDVDESLRICCSNIMELLKRNSNFTTSRNTKPSGSNNETEEPSSVERNRELYDSVYCEIATRLCLYVGETACLEIAREYPDLKEFLTRPVHDMAKSKTIIPWTSVSTVHRINLAKVARKLDCKTFEQFWMYKEHFASGIFGNVFAGISKKEGREVAVKRIVNTRMQQPEDKQEIRSLAALAVCEQVVRYLPLIEEDQNFSYVALELMEGSLEDYFTQAFDATKGIVLCQDVVMGLQYLHGIDHVHRDLKPSNILYKTYPKLCLKLADFGLSRNINNKSTITVCCTNAGTRCWMAPELLQSSVDHSKASDIFTCGLVFHYILAKQKHPFSPNDMPSKSEIDIHDTETNVKNNNTEGWDNSLSPEAAHLIRSMIESDNAKRPTAAEALAHPMFWSQKKKVDFLTVVGHQPEFRYSRSEKVGGLGEVEADLENQFGNIVKYGDWNDARYLPMPAIYHEMRKKREYDTQSAVELVRFIIKAYKHVSDVMRLPPFKKQLLEDFVFFHEFPHLVMEVYKVVTAHEWHQSRDEVRYKLNDERKDVNIIKPAMANSKELQLKDLIRKKGTKIEEFQLQIDELKSQLGNHVTKISELEEEVKHLKADKARLEMQLDDTTEQLDLLQTSHKELLTSHDKLDTSHDELQTSHDKLQTSHDKLQASHDELSNKVDTLEGKESILIMAQAAYVLQEYCYQYVFAPKEIPTNIRSNIHSYNVKKLTKDIKKAKHLTSEEKEEANTKWEELKTELGWDDEEDLKNITEIKTLRNVKPPAPAHPPLTQLKVDKAAEDFVKEVPEFPPHILQKLNQMWSTMNEKINGPK